jgi:hypothetical protein
MVSWERRRLQGWNSNSSANGAGGDVATLPPPERDGTDALTVVSVVREDPCCR